MNTSKLALPSQHRFSSSPPPPRTRADRPIRRSRDAVAANQIDIDAGKLAKSRTKNKEVSKFAQLMITDHAAVNKQAGALAKKLGVTTGGKPHSKELKDGAAQNIGKPQEPERRGVRQGVCRPRGGRITRRCWTRSTGPDPRAPRTPS